jgi:heme A synthase
VSRGEAVPPDFAATRARASARRTYRIAALALVVYVADVLLGKAGVLFKFVPPFRLGEVGEFLVVLFAMVFFVAGLLADAGVPANKSAVTEEES